MITPFSTMIKVSSKGQIALPKEFREAIGINAGSRIVVNLHKKLGSLELRPALGNISEIFGAAKEKTSKTKKSNIDTDIMKAVLAEDNKTKG